MGNYMEYTQKPPWTYNVPLYRLGKIMVRNKKDRFMKIKTPFYPIILKMKTSYGPTQIPGPWPRAW